VQIRVRGPRAEPHRPSVPCLLEPARRTPVRATVRLHLRPGQKGTKQLLAQYGDRLICVRYRYDARRKKGLKTVELLVAERVGAATASLRPRPDRRVTDPLRRRRSPRPREGGWWYVEPRAKGVGIALRSRHRARPGGPDRLGRRGQARPEHLTVDTATGGPRHPLSDAGRHPDIDASIHWWMLASDHGSRALQSNYS
jgi:hypothetical protein